MKLINLILLSGLVLSGCGGSKDPVVDNDGGTTPEQPGVDYRQLKTTPQTEAALVLADSSLLDTHIKNGIRLQLASNYPYPGAGGSNSSSGSFGGGFSSSNGSGSSSSSSSSSGAVAQPGDPNYTDTNVHVAGVDEADYAKYDGRHWYVATRPEYRDYFIADEPGIQIAATDASNASLEVVGHIPLEAEWGTINDMYLVQDKGNTTHLAVIRKLRGYGYGASSSSGGFFTSTSSSGVFNALSVAATSSSSSTGGGLPYPGDYYQRRNGRIRVQLIDVENPALPQQDWAITMDGDFVDSRRIGDVLYLVTSFNPWVPGLQPDYYNGATRATNEQILANTPVSALLPQYDLGDGNKPLTSSCYIQEGVNQQMGHAGVIHITAIDLKSQNLIGSQCMNGTAASISMSLESLYLTGTVWSSVAKTVIHKFSLDEDGPVYEATGSVPGHITGRSDPAFRLHEHEGDLRIVTTRWDAGPVHQLFILSQSGDSLDVVAQLPNSAQPAPIGKPGEDIYSVRFEAERAYIVTFRQSDPLYAIDLSDRLAPKILGELEIPGFATYMHPLNSRYLFTFGQDADELGRALGLKAELIDVGDGSPKSVKSLLIGSTGTYSEALRNLKALSLLKVNDDEWRIALPVSMYESNGAAFNSGWRYNGLQLFSVTGLSGNLAELKNTGVLITENAEQHYVENRANHSRSVLHNDAVFLAHNNAFWSASWDELADPEGPKAYQLVTCPDEPGPGISVQFYADIFTRADACAGNITIRDGEYQETLEPQPKDSEPTSCTFKGAFGRPGDYVLQASLPGFTSTLRQVKARPSRCGAHTTQVFIHTVPAEGFCEGIAPPSVVARFLVQSNNASCLAVVEAEQNGMVYALDLVDSLDIDGATICEFSGADGIAGQMTVKANVPGYQEYTETLFVPEDFCRVQTQHLQIDLLPLP